jgi:2-polyprenyl-6-hydroxyphenyl methylase/3-demethylubiquinone-9 3-methyltransferase
MTNEVRQPTILPVVEPTRAERAKRAAITVAGTVLAVGIGSGLRPYRPQRVSAQRWDGFYDSGRFDYMNTLWELPRYAALLGYLRVYPGTPDVLDIGCGPGYLRQLMTDEDFGSYAGVDLSPAAVRSASALADSRTSFAVGDATTMELPQVDVVVMNEVLCYIEDRDAFLDRVAASVRPGGLVLTSLYRHPGDHSLWRQLDRKLSLVSAMMARPVHSPYNRRGFRVSCHTVR